MRAPAACVLPSLPSPWEDWPLALAPSVPCSYQRAKTRGEEAQDHRPSCPVQLLGPQRLLRAQCSVLRPDAPLSLLSPALLHPSPPPPPTLASAPGPSSPAPLSHSSPPSTLPTPCSHLGLCSPPPLPPALLSLCPLPSLLRLLLCRPPVLSPAQDSLRPTPLLGRMRLDLMTQLACCLPSYASVHSVALSPVVPAGLWGGN